jgi:UDP-glucose 6-dehydrogenase
MRISVIGTGHLGATHAACLAWGVDRDPSTVDMLQGTQAPFQDEGLDDLLGQALRCGRLRFPADLREAADDDVHLVGVGTPESAAPAGRLDLTAWWGALDGLAPLLTRCDALDPVVLRPRVRDRRVVDTRHALDRQCWERAGRQHWCDGVDPVTAAVRDGVRAVPA